MPCELATGKLDLPIMSAFPNDSKLSQLTHIKARVESELSNTTGARQSNMRLTKSQNPSKAHHRSRPSIMTPDRPSATIVTGRSAMFEEPHSHQYRSALMLLSFVGEKFINNNFILFTWAPIGCHDSASSRLKDLPKTKSLCREHENGSDESCRYLTT